MKIKKLLCLCLLLAAINISAKAQEKSSKAMEKRIEGLDNYLSVSPGKSREVVKMMYLNDAEAKQIFRDSSLNRAQREEKLLKFYSERRNKVNALLTDGQQQKMVHLLDPGFSIRRLSIEVSREERAAARNQESNTGTPKTQKP